MTDTPVRSQRSEYLALIVFYVVVIGLHVAGYNIHLAVWLAPFWIPLAVGCVALCLLLLFGIGAAIVAAGVLLYASRMNAKVEESHEQPADEATEADVIEVTSVGTKSP